MIIILSAGGSIHTESTLNQYKFNLDSTFHALWDGLVTYIVLYSSSVSLIVLQYLQKIAVNFMCIYTQGKLKAPLLLIIHSVGNPAIVYIYVISKNLSLYCTHFI